MHASVALSRRALLQAIAGLVATAATPFGWPEVALALDQAHGHGLAAGAPTLSFFSAADAADVAAVAAQIVPSDDTPGAREAGAIYFIDRALGTVFAQMGGDYRGQLAAFQAAARHRHPDTPSFAALTAEQQRRHLETVDQTPFFLTTRLLTLFGMFTLPEYGGNRDGVGWKLLGFEDRHVFRPPFGHYDRDYAGFVIAPVKTK